MEDAKVRVLSFFWVKKAYSAFYTRLSRDNFSSKEEKSLTIFTHALLIISNNDPPQK
jgi:hypothetical protein